MIFFDFRSRLRCALPLGAAALLAVAAAFAQQGADGAGGARQAAQPLAPLALEADAERGELIAYTCLGCHGVPGARNAYPSYLVPKLGGQNADYIEIALQGYRQGTREHPTMEPQASVLSDQDIADIAAYFASLEGEPRRGRSDASLEQIRAGRQQATTCTPCHGESGVAQAPQWPTLAGQHASYLVESLEQYRNGERTDPVMGPMVANLDDEALAQLAAYYAAQPGLYVPRD